MCGRYSLTHVESLAELYNLRESDLRPNYNVSPTHFVPVVFDESPDALSSAKWGLIPSWAKDAKIGSSLVNARAETVATKPSFRSAFKKRRCLIPADGFYEWKRISKTKVPYRIVVGDGELFFFAGLWETWNPPEGEPIRSCTIITCAPNELVAPIHDRMPIILPPERRDSWLARESSPDAISLMLAPYSADRMNAYPVDSRVNSASNNDATLIMPIQTPDLFSN